MENKLGGFEGWWLEGFHWAQGTLQNHPPCHLLSCIYNSSGSQSKEKEKNDKWKYFGSQTKNKEFRTNIFQQTVELSVGSIKHGDALANAQAQLTEHAEIQWRRKSSQGGSLIRSNCLLYLRRQKLFQGKLCAYSALLVPQCWLNKYKEWLAESPKILIGEKRV